MVIHFFLHCKRNRTLQRVDVSKESKYIISGEDHKGIIYRASPNQHIVLCLENPTFQILHHHVGDCHRDRAPHWTTKRLPIEIVTESSSSLVSSSSPREISSRTDMPTTMVGKKRLEASSPTEEGEVLQRCGQVIELLVSGRSSCSLPA